MPQPTYGNGQTSVVLRVKLLDSSSTTGAGLTGLTSASSGLIISTIANNEASPTTYTVAGSTIQTITTLGTYAAPTATKCRFKEVDSTNHKGVYELHFADARFAVSSAKSLLVSISGATNLAQCDVVIPLTSVNLYDGVRFGITALPNATAGGSAGLPTNDSTWTPSQIVVDDAVTIAGDSLYKIVRDALGMAAADLDTQLDYIASLMATNAILVTYQGTQYRLTMQTVLGTTGWFAQITGDLTNGTCFMISDYTEFSGSDAEFIRVCTITNGVLNYNGGTDVGGFTFDNWVATGHSGADISAVFIVHPDLDFGNKFNGITSVANWLKAMIRKSSPDAMAATEIGGTYDATTDSLEAIGEAGGGGGDSITVEQTEVGGNST